jgi:hypothetical protein
MVPAFFYSIQDTNKERLLKKVGAQQAVPLRNLTTRQIYLLVESVVVVVDFLEVLWVVFLWLAFLAGFVVVLLLELVEVLVS